MDLIRMSSLRRFEEFCAGLGGRTIVPRHLFDALACEVAADSVDALESFSDDFYRLAQEIYPLLDLSPPDDNYLPYDYPVSLVVVVKRDDGLEDRAELRYVQYGGFVVVEATLYSELLPRDRFVARNRMLERSKTVDDGRVRLDLWARADKVLTGEHVVVTGAHAITVGKWMDESHGGVRWLAEVVISETRDLARVARQLLVAPLGEAGEAEDGARS